MTDIRWYQTLALWKSIVFMEGNYKRAVSGATDDPYLKAFGEGVVQLAERAEALTRWAGSRQGRAGHRRRGRAGPRDGAALAAEGATVVAADVDGAGARAVAARSAATPSPATSPISRRTARRSRSRKSACGGLDLVHLNAGVATGCGVGDDFDLAPYRRAMGANLDGVVFGIHAALPALRARGGGAIVATASLAGLTGVAVRPALRGQQARRRGAGPLARPGLAAEGIRVNAVCPGFAESAIIEPIRDMIAASGVTVIPAEQVADAVVELFAGDAGGECVVVQPGRSRWRSRSAACRDPLVGLLATFRTKSAVADHRQASVLDP